MAQVQRFPFRRVYANDRQFKEYLSFFKSARIGSPHDRAIAILCKRVDELEARLRRLESKSRAKRRR
jgi:hypothetical protein